MQVKVPFLAEGVESGVVVSILVKEGDRVKKDQTLLELETNKATAPIQSPADGVVQKIMAKEGKEVAVGEAIFTLQESAGSAKPASQPSEEKSAPKPQGSQTSDDGDYTYQSKSGLPPPASPEVRKMAREFGIDLTKVRGTEQGGRITAKDVKNYLARLKNQPAQGGAKQPHPSIDFSKFGPVTKKPLTQIRKVIAHKMADSWNTIPHVTQFDEADITNLLEARKKFAPLYEEQGVKLTVTGIVLKVILKLLKQYPIFNSSLDEVKNEIVLKEYYNIGIAVDTEQGLLVPVIKNVDKKDLLEISSDLAMLSEKARSKKIALDDIQGSTFTISNLGSIGGQHFTPIVNHPDVAILGMGRGVSKPVVKDGKIQPRTMLPLALSYDHRVVDGADGAKFIQSLVQELEVFKPTELEIKKPSAKKVPEKKSSNKNVRVKK